MPASLRETVLCHYHYDPLDRLADCAVSAQADIQRFYCKSRLATEIQGAVQTSVFQHDVQLLAQQQSLSGKINTTLLATDQQRSVLNALDTTQPHPLAYTPYGHRPSENGLLSLLGFNGERPDPVTRHYHLGNGYRQFNPVLMRFNSPDSWSPFGEGGVNAYAYCGGDPVNRNDPTGHTWGPIKYLLRRVGLMKKSVIPETVVIGGWQQVPGNPERIMLSSNRPREPRVARLTSLEEREFHLGLAQARADGREMDRLLALSAQNPQPRVPSPPNLDPSRGTMYGHTLGPATPLSFRPSPSVPSPPNLDPSRGTTYGNTRLRQEGVSHPMPDLPPSYDDLFPAARESLNTTNNDIRKS